MPPQLSTRNDEPSLGCCEGELGCSGELTTGHCLHNPGQSGGALALGCGIPAVQVCARIRPPLASEAVCTSALGPKSGQGSTVTLRTTETGKVKHFRFDAVLGPDAGQQEVWEHAHMAGLMEQLVSGFHVTVLAYGQTGTGKTHTIEGSCFDGTVLNPCREQLGIVPRAVEDLFAHLDALHSEQPESGTRKLQWRVKFSFAQIYMERIYDLLSAEAMGGPGLRLREDTNRQFFVEGLSEYECDSPDDFFKRYKRGIHSKQMASTLMNAASSRSHTILTLSLSRCEVACTVKDKMSEVPEPQSNCAQVSKQVLSRLTLVDLCGSERTSTSSEEGIDKLTSTVRFQEAVNINKSLSVLRKVVTALSRRSASGSRAGEHVPYRESKLTSLLQHAIGGNSYLLMLACLSPSKQHIEESLSTLQYASQAAQIKNDPVPNIDPKDLVIDELQQQLLTAKLRIEALEQDRLVRAASPMKRRGFAKVSELRQPGWSAKALRHSKATLTPDAAAQISCDAAPVNEKVSSSKSDNRDKASQTKSPLLLWVEEVFGGCMSRPSKEVIPIMSSRSPRPLPSPRALSPLSLSPSRWWVWLVNPFNSRCNVCRCVEE